MPGTKAINIYGKQLSRSVILLVNCTTPPSPSAGGTVLLIRWSSTHKED